jgi:hypothetical protein
MANEAEGADPELAARAARIRLAKAQDCLSFLDFAKRARAGLDATCPDLEAAIVRATNEVARFSGMTGTRIEPRRRVPVQIRDEHSAPRREFLIFIDECGHHGLAAANDPFPVFCLCAVVVDREKFATFDRSWKSWKATWLGSWRKIVHEPDIRRRSDYFYFADPLKQKAAEDSLAAQLASLDFTCIAAVIDKGQLQEHYPGGQVDAFLPPSTYLMCVDFIFERIIHFLYHAGDDAYGNVTAESRGLREDAEVHAEFLRLQLGGTQFLSDRYFRNQLRPYIQFKRKSGNDSGLQIADLAARPIAEKVLDPGSTPERWQSVASKIYDGGKGRRSSYGLKVFPSPENAGILFGEKSE